MIIRLVELKKDEQKVQKQQSIEELLRNMMEDKDTCHALLGLGDTILKNIIITLESLKKCQITYEYQRFPVFMETSSAPITEGMLNFKHSSKKSTKTNNILLSPRGTLNSLMSVLAQAEDSCLVGDPSKLSHTFLKIIVNGTKKILIFMLIDANSEMLPLAHSILLQQQLDQANWAFMQHTHKKPTTQFSTCIANQLQNQRYCRIIMAEIHEFVTQSDWLTAVTKTQKTFRHTDSELLSPQAIEVHRSLLQMKKKQVLRLEREVEAQEQNLKHIWQEQVSQLQTHFLEQNRRDIIKLIDRRHCLEECEQMAQKIQQLQLQIERNEAAKKKLEEQLRNIHKDLKQSRIEAASQFLQLAEAFKQQNAAKKISIMKVAITPKKKPSRYSSVLTLLPLQVTNNKKNDKSKLDKTMKTKDIELQKNKRLKSIEQSHQQEMVRLRGQHEHRHRTLVRRAHDATHNLRNLIQRAILESSSCQEKQEISMLKSQIDSKRSRVI